MTVALKALQYIEVDLDYCALTYGNSPCTAALGVTGDIKCFNTPATCQDRDNFDNEPVTFRFAVPAGYLPPEIEAIPSIESIEFDPGAISLGENLGQRSTLTVTFNDHPDTDTGAGFDKYLADRDYDPYAQGSFFGKFRARHPFVRGRALRWVHGFAGQALAEMETRHYVIDSISGPSADGRFKLVAKDILKLADSDRALAPQPSTGFLAQAVSETDRFASLSPVGILASEYPVAGVVNSGGRECWSYVRESAPGNDANALLVLHCDGTDGATTFSDSSASARTATPAGNAQVDTAQSVFGGASALFDGAGDIVTFPDSNDWTFAGDFTIDCWIRVSSVASTRAVFGHGASANNQYRLFVATDGALTFQVISGGSNIVAMSSSAGAIVINTWYHIAVVRSGNNWAIYRDGTSVATTTDADAIPNFAGLFRVGADGNSANDFAGWIDEFRVSNVARWTANFTAPTMPYVAADQIYLSVRGEWNSEASSHEAQDRVQLCLQYTAQDAADIIADLLENYAGVDSSYIPLSTWQDETGTYLNRLYSARIANPTAVNALISELVEQAALALWWRDEEQEVALRVIRGADIDAFTYDHSRIMARSLGVEDQPEKRISQVLAYFAQINPLTSLTDAANYRSLETTVDDDAEADYGSAAIRQVFSRWIPSGGRSIATRMNEIRLGRYRDPPRRFKFSVMREGPDGGENNPQKGASIRLSHWTLQDETGARVSVPAMITRVRPTATHFEVEAEEDLYTAPAEDLATRPIIIDVDTFNFDWRAAHDLLYPEAENGDTVTCTIASGVIVGSLDRTLPAFDVGTWASGITRDLINHGRIQGAGGKGGLGSISPAAASNGESGGKALLTTFAVNLDNTDGEIWGGGGGGGGGVGNPTRGGGGGGGAGTVPGNPGGPPGTPGDPGTPEAGGAGGGGTSSGGGDGGGPGAAGSDGYGPTLLRGDGGAAGVAIDGASLLSISGAGDVVGPTIN